ncbi:flavin-nucleotide-binding protein [Ophiostoma piceae UAMH 11346]|uniref:Flavin-nucleotide-binding protein n=1 Tax=Ophiostoma piceae (strain UAMH 11346) TaxID=1262450 RepID=S3D787_OPHP1|nr:flavin-nucleotide-binding protein [Ophiostoma piceae UAMH 11346]
MNMLLTKPWRHSFSALSRALHTSYRMSQPQTPQTPPKSEMEPALLRRFGERGRYELEDAQSVFDGSFIAHVSYVDDGLPACQPMIALIREEPVAGEAPSADDADGTDGADTTESDGKEHRRNAFVYLHGHPTTRLMELVKQATKAEEAAQEARAAGHDEPPVPPVKVCITATKIDGLALSTAPNGHTFNYRSAMIHGTCSQVRGKDVKRDIMHAVTNQIVANRVHEVNPISSMVVNLVYVVRVSIDRLSVKARMGVPGIQPRNADVDGPDIEPPAWAGVVPLWEQLGEPIASGLTPGAVVSDNLRAFISERNAKHEAYAKKAAK